MKFITFCLDKALHHWNIRPILEGRTNCATWSYLENVDLKSNNIAYADEYYHPMTPLSQSSESNKHQSNSNNTSDSTSFDREQRKKIKLDYKVNFYSFNKLHEGYIF
jgi:hypothetical protein